MRGRGLLVFFTLTLLIPGAALAALGIRAVLQERRLVEHEIRELLERTGDDSLSRFERELRDWTAVLERAVHTGANASVVPPRLRPAFAARAGVLIVASPEITIWPAPSEADTPPPRGPAPAPLSPALATAEAFELTAPDPSSAIERYRQVLAGVAVAERPRVIHRLARAFKRNGQDAEALGLFHELRVTPGTIGVLPASLVGRYEICGQHATRGDAAGLGSCAADLLQRLADGDWQLTRERVIYYSSTAAGWLSTALAPKGCSDLPVSTARLSATNDTLAVWLCGGVSNGTRTGVAVKTDWAATHLWPLVAAPTLAEGYDISIADRAGHVRFSTAPPPPPDTPHATRDGTGLLEDWRVRVWAKDPGAVATMFAARQRLSMAMLTLVLASLGFGAYATSRAVRRELQMAQMKSDFVSTVSHEFRSPLTAIRQLGEMLGRNRVPDARRHEYYERITRESERLGRLVENLLDFAQMEAGRKRYALHPLDTAAWLHRSVNEFRTVREEQGPVVDASIPESLPAIAGDPAALTTAVHNLLDNAVKYSPGQHTVWLHAEATGDCVVIRVRDRGVGIADRDKARIFERFYRVGGDISRQVKGAGLGLSLVAHIVTAHNGRIHVDSRIGEGTTFTIELKAVAA
jgi:signal transduction histidine kinase